MTPLTYRRRMIPRSLREGWSVGNDGSNALWMAFKSPYNKTPGMDDIKLYNGFPVELQKAAVFQVMANTMKFYFIDVIIIS